MSKKQRKNKGFTLSELLITLGIVSVIATLTIPNLLTNIRAIKLEASFKKSYNNLSVVLQKVKFDQGETIYGNYSSITTPSIIEAISQQFIKNDFISAKNDGKLAILPVYRKYNSSVHYAKQNYDDGWLIINDSFYIFVNCDAFEVTNIQLLIDINGKQKPNEEGYDLFVFKLDEGDKLIPMGFAKQAINDKDYFKKLP